MANLQPAPTPSLIPLMIEAAGPEHALAVPALLRDGGATAAATFAAQRATPGVHLLLRGDRDYYAVLRPDSDPATVAALQAHVGSAVMVRFAERSPLRRLLAELAVGTYAATTPAATPAPPPPAASAAVAVALASGSGAAPLFLLPEGTFCDRPTGPAPMGMAALSVLVTAARWISARRTSTFECLLAPSAFHPDLPLRTERLTAAQAPQLLAQVASALAAAAVGGTAARADANAAAQVRSAGLTVLSHVVGTVLKDPSFRPLADAATEQILTLIDHEQEPESTPVEQRSARPALRSHAIQLLQLRSPALSAAHRQRASELLQKSYRESPPYEQLRCVWRFAMCGGGEFDEGETAILCSKYGFKPIDLPADAPPSPVPSRPYKALLAPFVNPAGLPIQIFSRAASPRDENLEMAAAGFIGLIINRHSQLGTFDMQATAVEIHQAGYKLLMNTQCTGLSTRFAIAKVFPDADIYSSWDSTFFRHEPNSSKLTASEGIDCFMALLSGLAAGETHAQLAERMRQAQWSHSQGSEAGFEQFIGPAHPLVVARYTDVNQDGHADFYDGFLDFTLKAIATDLRNSATPRDPQVAASQVSGEAAKGLDWAAGSLNRVTQCSDLWSGLPGNSELLYIFTAGGFYSQNEPPRDVPVGSAPGADSEPGLLPAVCRYNKIVPEQPGGPELSVDVMFHSYLSHASWEYKRLLCAAEALRRALDLGYLPATGPLSTPLGQRGALLLTLTGLLEFPADQNFIDGLWSMALSALNLPAISRSLCRRCITDADHDAANYYGSLRGLAQLLGDEQHPGELQRTDPAAFAKLQSADPTIGRARPLTV